MYEIYFSIQDFPSIKITFTLESNMPSDISMRSYSYSYLVSPTPKQHCSQRLATAAIIIIFYTCLQHTTTISNTIPPYIKMVALSAVFSLKLLNLSAEIDGIYSCTNATSNIASCIRLIV